MNRETLDKEKERKIALAKDYDKSQAVNSFMVNGSPAWLDKATRVGLINSLQIEKAAGREESTIWLNGVAYTLSIDDALKMLTVIELYAVDCFNTTENHIKTIKELDDLNRVYNYNYTKGYPKRLRFELNIK
jgi:hypothetical protein